MISDCRGYHPREYFTTSELVKRYFHTLTAPLTSASGAARVLCLCVPLRPSERLSRPLERRTSTATARTSCAPRRVSRSPTRRSEPASIGCTRDDCQQCSRSQRTSRPWTPAPARQARMPAGVLLEASRRWAGRISSTAPRAHARAARARPDLSGGVGFASTPRAPHRLAHVTQPICITDKAVPDGSEWFRVRPDFRPHRPDHAEVGEESDASAASRRMKKAPPDASSGATRKPRPSGAIAINPASRRTTGRSGRTVCGKGSGD